MWSKTIVSVAEQLTKIIKDYDVSYQVAEIYVKKRIHDSIEESRQYHLDRLSIKMTPKYWMAFQRKPHSKKSFIDESKNIPERGILLHIDDNFITFKTLLGYIFSKYGIRSYDYRIAAAAWGISNLDKENLTIREKLNDMKIIPYMIIEQISYKYWENIIGWPDNFQGAYLNGLPPNFPSRAIINRISYLT